MQAKGTIDLHCHILPGMDDGSPDAETSVAMLRRQAEQGVDVVCATSHYYVNHHSIGAFCERRAAALEKLQAVVPEGLPRVILGAEVAFFAGISECRGLSRLCIQGTRTLLLEMPFTEWNSFEVEEVEALVLDRNYHVVLVHPERFCTSRRNLEKLWQLDELPVGFQVNVGTLTRWRSRKWGLELLRGARYPLLGSDSHNLTSRPPNLQEGRRAAAQKLGQAFVDRMDRNAAWLLKPETEKVNP